jgi:hypothetical protein
MVSGSLRLRNKGISSVNMFFSSLDFDCGMSERQACRRAGRQQLMGLVNSLRLAKRCGASNHSAQSEGTSGESRGSTIPD